jgi:gluconolactonase
VIDGKKLNHTRQFVSLKQKQQDGTEGGTSDDVRVDTDDNVWAGAGWVGTGYDGVHICGPDGQRIGQILCIKAPGRAS